MEFILLALNSIGFTPIGSLAGSAAASWQSTIGNVPAGSVFAFLQSITMSKEAVGVAKVAGFLSSLA
ncbi:hypothetical protein NW754_006130 [Fusarium falciforme]|uniref:Uncharacterized protein n=1 Tax=Fusarium falciforme TaxID=195108 RepID=A0A9W8RHA7_9HYPO|nr:hypothetical protein NW754_006130 [Fusarium falciforme]KAJ4198175.1 hypothetical protein NW755_000863 [Fusarium falciforme]KAJ4261974.1 hypothetical protein NW757_000245 [Fusarium falciforme]